MPITNLESSSIKLKRHTGSAGFAPPSLLEGEFAINLIDGNLYYGTQGGNSVSQNFAFANISSSGYISSSGAFFDGDIKVIGTGSFDVIITNYESSSIIYSSGSTKFGDTLDDTHEFTGSVFISASEFYITGGNGGLTYDVDSSPPSLYVGGGITSSANISASGYISASEVYADTGDFRVVSASEYHGITPTQYKTGSDSNTSLDLSLFQIKNYDTDIFVTASGTQLILQFGTPKFPTIGALTGSGFTTNRFAGPYVDGNQNYVIDSSYVLSFTYTLDPTNEFISGALLANVNGVSTEIASNTTDTGTGTLSFNINATDYQTYFHSGSHGFTGSLEVELADGSKQSFQTEPEDLTISKNNPNTPTIDSISYTNLEKTTTYVTNTSPFDTTTSKIEEGITGTITYNSSSGFAGGWDLDRVDDNSPGDPQSLVINETNAPTISITAYYDTNNSGDNPSEASTNVSNSKDYTRIRSIRSGASPNSASLTEDEIHNITAWVDGDEIEDGNIQFDTTDIVNDTTFVSITNTSVAYYYIIYDSDEADLTALRQGSTEGSNVLSSWTKSTVGNYKVYRLTLQSSPVTDNKFYLYN